MPCTERILPEVMDSETVMASEIPIMAVSEAEALTVVSEMVPTEDTEQTIPMAVSEAETQTGVTGRSSSPVDSVIPILSQATITIITVVSDPMTAEASDPAEVHQEDSEEVLQEEGVASDLAAAEAEVSDPAEDNFKLNNY